jgi:hypothetical protein
MKITIDIDENELKELVTEKIASKMAEKWSQDGYVCTKEFKEIAREILYEKNMKQKLIDASVKMAAAELCRKGLPKLWRTDK